MVESGCLLDGEIVFSLGFCRDRPLDLRLRLLDVHRQVTTRDSIHDVYFSVSETVVRRTPPRPLPPDV